jgi:hypothetical protein
MRMTERTLDWDKFIEGVEASAYNHAQGWGTDHPWLTRGRELVLAANLGRPDFVGFAASLRSEASGPARTWGGTIRTPTAGELLELQRLADEVERVGESLGFV